MLIINSFIGGTIDLFSLSIYLQVSDIFIIFKIRMDKKADFGYIGNIFNLRSYI